VLQGPAFCFQTSGIPLTCPLSAQRLATLLATALRPVDTEAAKVVDMEETKDTVAVAVSAADVKVDRPATPAVDMVTCLVSHAFGLFRMFLIQNQVIALKAKSATTAARSVISPETAPPRPAVSVLATSASNPATSRLNARTKLFSSQYLQ
jgi:hypothetical protein